MSQARRSGRTSKGNTLALIAVNPSMNEAPVSGLTIGMVIGRITATAMLINTTYETVSERLPPNLLVITPAAAAVGQMKQSMAHSARILRSPEGIVATSHVRGTNVTIWKASTMKCHFRNFRS